MSHAAVKSFDRRGISCKNARTVQFSGGVEKCPVYDIRHTRKFDVGCKFFRVSLKGVEVVKCICVVCLNDVDRV